MAGRDRHGAMPPQPIEPRAPSRIDLHTHTTMSDGVLQPEALVAAAYDAGVRVLAVTDHDTLAGVRRLLRGPLPADLMLIPGVEINTVADQELHVLGLGVDPEDEAFEAALARQREARRTRFALALQRLRAAGVGVDEHIQSLGVDDEQALGRPTLARALVAAGHAATVDEAFERYLVPGSPGFVPRQGLGPPDTIRAIRAAGGLAVLAHLWDAERRLDLLRELELTGLRGLEVYHVTFLPPEVAVLERIAREHRLVATGGTDYHGDTGTYAEFHARLAIPAEVGPAVLAALGRDRGRAIDRRTASA